MPKLFQYQSKGEPVTVPVVAAPGQPPLDTEIPAPQWRSQVAKFTSAALLASLTAVAFVPVAPFPERSTPDKYEQPVQPLKFFAPRNQWIYRDFSAEPLPHIAASKGGPSVIVLGQKLVSAGSRNTEVFVVQSQEIVTLDKWWQRSDEPVFTRIEEIPDSGNGPATTTFAEKVSVDRWNPLPNVTVFDAGRRQWDYQNEFIPDRQQLPDLDSWVPPTVQPQYDLKRIQALYPAGGFSQFQFKESSTADRWHPEISRPRFDLVRAQYTFQNFGTADRQQTPDADSWGPVEVRQPVFDIPRLQYLGTWHFSPTSTTFVERTTPDKWLPLDNEPVETRAPRADMDGGGWTALVATTPAVNIDSWWQRTSEPVFVRPEEVPEAGAGSPFPIPPDLDGWHGEISRPVFRQANASWVYPAASVGPISTTFAERSTIDKWNPLPNLPVFDQPQRQWSYQNEFIPDQQQIPDSDSWTPAVNQPLFDLKRQQFTYAFAESRPFATTFPERVSPDRWMPELARPVFFAPRNSWIFPEAGFQALLSSYAELITTAKWHPEIQRPVFLAPRSQWTYPEASRGPISNVFAERSTLDKWWQAPNVPLYDLGRRQFEYQSFVEPDQQQIPDVDSWWQLVGQPQFDLKRLQALAPTSFQPVSTVYVERSTADKWHPLTAVPLFDQRRAQFDTPSFVGPDQQQKPDLDSWVPEIRQPLYDLKRTQVLYPSFIIDPAPRAETVSSDRWHPLVQVPLFDLKRAQYDFQFFLEPDRQQLPDFDSWAPAAIQPLFDAKRIQSLYPFLAFSQTAFAERVSPDRWMPEIQRPRFDLVRAQANYPSLSLDPQPFPSPIFAGNWHPEVQQPLFDRARIQQRYWFWNAGPVSSIFGERITPDKWAPLANQPQFDLTRKQFLAQTFAIDGVPRKESVSIDRWHLLIVQPLFDARRAQYDYPAFVAADQQPVARLDSWTALIVQPNFDQKRIQFIYPSLALHPQPYPPVFAGTWHPLIAAPQFDRPKAQQPDNAGPSFVQERIFADKWTPEIRERFAKAGFFIHDSGTSSLFIAERIQADKWQAETQRPVRAAARLIVDGPGHPGTIAAVLPEWYPSADYRRPPVRSTQSLAGELAPVTARERITPDKWHPLVAQPLFDQKRMLWIYQFPQPTFVGLLHTCETSVKSLSHQFTFISLSATNTVESLSASRTVQSLSEEKTAKSLSPLKKSDRVC